MKGSFRLFSRFGKESIRKKHPDGDSGRVYQDLFQFLVRQITVPRNAEQLIQLANKAHLKNDPEIFQTYLLLEKYICTFEPEQKYRRESLRQHILLLFPALQKQERFCLLFLSDTAKKNTLAIEFLSAFLQDVQEQFGQAGNGFVERQQSILSGLKGNLEEEDSFRSLQVLSSDIFSFIQLNYGATLAGRIFERHYDALSQQYKELEVFPHLITLIPKEIVRKEHLGIFSQAQIEQVFLEKLAETEQLNRALDLQIREVQTTQQLLSENEAMLRSVISSALDGIVITDEQGKIVQWNKAASQIFGYTMEEVLGQPVIGTLIPESILQSWNFQPERFFRNPENPLLNTRLEITCLRKDGSAFPAEFTITAFRNGPVHFFNGFVRDISLPKQREEELIRTKEKAEAAAKAKSQFLSIMSHELRTPLNAVIGFTELLMQNTPRPDQLEDLKMLQFSGENLLNIINDILDFSKLDSGKVQLSYTSFNLKELTQSLYQSFSYKAREKNVIFDVEYDEQMPFQVRGDSLRLSQILNNLISNAIKFTDTGSVTLQVHREAVLSDGISVGFSVRDTGIGIPLDKQAHIFEQFTQADSHTTRLYGGTGLGLAISARLAELMGSHIAIKSAPGEGSTFSFTLKLLASEEERPAVVAQNISDKTKVLHGKKILLAEDNTFNANIARRYIKGWGAELDVALDGEQALEFISRNHYDIILMDVQMPLMDGYTCSKAIRKFNSQIPIIAITAAPIGEVLESIKNSGMNDYVSKPFKPAELLQKLEGNVTYKM